MTDMCLKGATEGLKRPLDEAAVDAVRGLLIAHRRVEEKHYASALASTLPLLIDALQSADGNGKTRINCSDTLSIWMLRAAQLAQKEQGFQSEIPRLLNDERLDFLFTYTLDYWNETGSPLSNSLKDLFTKLVAILKRQDYQKRFEQWAKRALEVQYERRVKYYLLEILCKEIHETDFIIKHDPQFIEKSLTLIGSNALGSLIGRCLGVVMKRLYINEDNANEWVASYWTPVIEALKGDELRDGVEHHLLPTLFKTSAASFKIVVNQIKDDTDLLISCLNIGQQLAIEQDPFPEIVTRDTVEGLLVREQYKIKIFQLLTYSPKGARQINVQVFDILKQYIGLFLVDTEVETRMEFVSLFKQFLYRIKDSSYALNRDATKMIKREELREEAEEKLKSVLACKDFVQWILQLIKTQILPGSQYQRVISGLTILRQIVESNLDPNIVFKMDINYPFKVNIFDDVLKRLVLDNVLSTYDDIRANAVYLLNVSNSAWSPEEKHQIISRGFEMLSDYTRSDSGAKILEMSYNIFGDSTIYDKLIREIPLTDNIQEGVKHPLDGYFQALGLILSHDKKDRDIKTLIKLSEKSWSVLKEILVHDSPEGCDQYGVGSAQLVLSYGWRSTKESTLLLQQVLDMEVSDDDIIRIGELTLDQLATVRHRGAFSSVYPTFIKIASLCQKRMPNQNKAWLDANIELVQTKTQLITRRSGGLPFLITAIVSVERDLISYAFDRLFEIANIPVNVTEESEKMDIAQVHAFNCIKTLFIESQLAQQCAPYLYKGLELAISSFNSKIWSVRNCSIMLFTALQNRLFGRKKLSARVFFSRFKGIKFILIQILKESSEDLETLFPVLTILSKLESTPGFVELDEFLPLIRKCLEAKYWKIRECASRALPALVSDSKKETLTLLNHCSTSNQNKLHGYLLGVKVLNTVDHVASQLLFSLVEKLLIENQCYATKKTFLDVLSLTVVPQEIRSLLKKEFISQNSEYEVDGSKQLYLQALYKLVIDHDFIVAGLGSNFFEVRLEAIAYCTQYKINHEIIDNIAKDDSEFTYVRSKAIPLYENYDVDKILEFSTNQDVYGEDIKCSCLELLGSVVAKTGDHFSEWIELIRENSGDDEPFPVRMSTLKSLLRYLTLKSSAKVSWLAYQFLSDDDSEIRHLASTFFDAGVEPWISSVRFSSTFGHAKEELEIVVKEMLDFKPRFRTLGNEKVLFNVEKKNLYRNEIEQHTQLSRMLQNGRDVMTDEQRAHLLCHFEAIRDSLQQMIEKNGRDGILGWSNNEALFEDIYATGIHLKTLDVPTDNLEHTSLTNNLHIALYRSL
jgi:hypothetical protein